MRRPRGKISKGDARKGSDDGVRGRGRGRGRRSFARAVGPSQTWISGLLSLTR